VSFNDHEGSAKSYAYTRRHEVETVSADFVPLRREIKVPESHEETTVVRMHDGSHVRLHSTAPGYNPRSRDTAYRHVQACIKKGEVATGLLFIDDTGRCMHDMHRTVPTPLAELPFDVLCPGGSALDALMERYR
jgi:2-oxoglutarate ferredoxin oxidoreductase subunit beta